jgi:hypothetical protein
MSLENFQKKYNSCSKIIKTTLHHCEIIFYLYHECTNRCQQTCPNTNNLLPQYYTQNPIIQNQNQNHTHTIQHDKPTSMPWYVYTRLNKYPIQQILDIKTTTRKDNYSMCKKKISIYAIGHYQTTTPTQGGWWKIKSFHIKKTISQTTTYYYSNNHKHR